MSKRNLENKSKQFFSRLISITALLKLYCNDWVQGWPSYTFKY